MQAIVSKVKAIYIINLPIPGVELLPEGHEGRHLRSPEPEGLQRTSGLSIGQRRMPPRARHALHHDALGARRFALSHRRKY